MHHSAQILVLPSDLEPWALVVQEALAAGLVVVASDVVGAAFDMVDDRRSGRIFPAGNLLELKRALLDVTNAAAINSFRDESKAEFARWLARNNPVAEIRRALLNVGVLGNSPSETAECCMISGAKK